MKAHQNTDLATLTEDEILCVGGSGGLPRKELRAEDKYGNTISIEEYMDRQLLAAMSGDSRWVFGNL